MLTTNPHWERYPDDPTRKAYLDGWGEALEWLARQTGSKFDFDRTFTAGGKAVITFLFKPRPGKERVVEKIVNDPAQARELEELRAQVVSMLHVENNLRADNRRLAKKVYFHENPVFPVGQEPWRLAYWSNA